MVFFYLFIGLLAAVVAATPPGAANIAVVNTAIESNWRKALYLSIGASLGEVILALIALHCTLNFSQFFEANPWVQIAVFIAFFIIGLFFLARTLVKKKMLSRGNRKFLSIKKGRVPKFINGFLLAFINPQVLIFWVLAFTIIHKYILMISDMSSWFTLLLFFIGVFLGKLITLYGYGKWGKKLDSGSKDNKTTIYRFIGIALVLLSIVQGARFFIS